MIFFTVESQLPPVPLTCARLLVADGSNKDRQFALQLADRFASLDSVRGFTIICLVVLSASASWAQTQEPSLVDRLLRPNMELKNNAQNKTFAVNSTVATKGGTVGTFYLQPNPTESSFQDLRVVSTTKHSSPAFHSDRGNAALLQKTANGSVNFPIS